MRRFAPLLLLSTLASAQVFIVDANNGPGAHFTQIAAAVAAVPDGAVLDVRPGTYSRFQIQTKSLTLLGGPGVVVSDATSPTVLVTGLGTQQSVVLRGLVLSNPLGDAQLRCDASIGPILIDSCVADPGIAGVGGHLVAAGCQQIHVRQSTFFPTGSVSAIDTNGSNTVLADCVVQVFSGTVAVRVVGGHLDLVASTVLAGVFSDAIELGGSELRVVGDSTIWGSAVFGQWGLAVTGSGSARIDPSTMLLHVPPQPFGPNVQVTQPSLPWVAAAPGNLGGTATADLFGPATGLSALFVGFPAVPHQIPGLPDKIWLLPGSEAMHTAGTGTVSTSYVVPNSLWVLGVRIAWQGVTFEPLAGLQASTPAVYAHH